MLRPDLWNRAVRISVAVTIVLFILIWLRPPQRADGRRIKMWFQQSTGAGKHHHNHQHHEADISQDDCLLPPFADDVVITVKTGASEAYSRIPTQMISSLRCPPHVLHFSDMGQKLGNITIHDALAAVPEFLRAGNPEFDLYRDQNAKKKLGWMDAAATEKTKEAAWNLDKWKNLHILEKSWHFKPAKKWYLHVDADTYVVWSSLLWWLQQLDDKEPLYAGSLTCFGDVKAAHGGSGILLSEKAMKIVVENKTTIPALDQDASNHCCGDELVARAMQDNNVPMHNVWPIISGDGPFTTAFGPQQWCEPIVTMHHISIGAMEMLGIFEQRRVRRHVPLTYAELFNDFVFDALPNEPQINWDNSADGIEVPSLESYEQCNKECDQNDACFQWSFDGTTCSLGTRNFKLGVERPAKDGKSWTSGWNKKRIRDWADKHTDCTNVSLAFKDAFVCG